MPALTRDFDAIVRSLPAGMQTLSREQRMRLMVDAVWDALHDKGVSWVGFYIDHPDLPDDQRLILGPCRNRPACSPIGLHGVCGQVLRSGKTMIVRDVADLGANYVACDPRDKAEVCIPLFDEKGNVWGVFDVDSWEVGAFGEHDVAGFCRVLRTFDFE
jgi:putative methionine-R-sulfoxide reductase with GAF domain